MRLSNYTLIIIIATFLWGGKSADLPVTIKGHLRKNPSDTSAYIMAVTVFVKGDNKVLARTFTDWKGDFSLTFTPGKETSFDFYCTGVGIDTLLMSSITTFESDTPEMTFYIPGQHKRNAQGKVICPKCRREDKVYKIEYGFAPIVTRHISKSGDTTYSPLYKGTYQEGCVVGPAKYYCDRDKAKF